MAGYFQNLPTRHFTSEVDWFAAEAASPFYQRVFFYVADQADYEELVDSLHKQETDELAICPWQRPASQRSFARMATG